MCLFLLVLKIVKYLRIHGLQILKCSVILERINKKTQELGDLCFKLNI